MSRDTWKPFNRKKKIKETVVGVVKSLGEFFHLDILVGTKFVRDFSRVKPIEQTKPYLIPQEYEDEDEQTIIDMLVETFVDDTEEDEDIEPGAARQTSGHLKSGFQDPHWGNTTGHLFGTLEMDARINELHPDLRAGLFKKEGTYKVYCRPNYLYDPGLPIAINRMSLKLQIPDAVPNVYAESGQANELDLLLSEGLPASEEFEPDGQGFFFRDARQLLMANEMKDGLFSLAGVLFDKADARVAANWKKFIFDRNTDGLYREHQTQLTWDKKWYFSAGPYRLGPGAMKFALEPEDTSPGEPIEIFARPDLETQPSDAEYHPATAHQDAFSAFTPNREVRFTLKVQIATLDSIPDPKEGDPAKCVMAAEYADIAWNAPFIPVGSLTLQPHEVDLTDPENRWYAMGFNSWNTFKETEPLGQLFRARKSVHLNHRAARLKHSFLDSDTSPSLGKCPFR